MADLRRVLERRLRESLAEHPEPEPFPLALRRAQERRRRWAWLRDLSGDALVLTALSLLYAALCCAAAWRLWP